MRPIVAHLVRQSNPASCFSRFMLSLYRYRAGCDYDLIIIRKGFNPPEPAEGWAIDVSDEGTDLTAYQKAISYLRSCRSPDAPIVFLNSFSEILCDDWLVKMVDALGKPGVGLVGCTGSWESSTSSAPWWKKPLLLPWFPLFPNPHIRTNAFLARLGDLADWPRVTTKMQSYALESGRWSLTQRMAAKGLRSLVVSATGVFDPKDWPSSYTFRSGSQDGLMVSDNQTRAYQAAPDRAAASWRAWGCGLGHRWEYYYERGLIPLRVCVRCGVKQIADPREAH